MNYVMAEYFEVERNFNLIQRTFTGEWREERVNKLRA